MSTSKGIWPKLARSKKYREEFVAAHAKQAIPYQIRALMKQYGLSQKELAERAGLTQGAISRAADPDYGNLTINTLVRIAAGFDVAFVGRFIPFSELPPWFDRLYQDGGFYVSSFNEEAIRHHQPEVASVSVESIVPATQAPESPTALPTPQQAPVALNLMEALRRSIDAVGRPPAASADSRFRELQQGIA